MIENYSDAEIYDMKTKGTKMSILKELTLKTKDEINEIISREERRRNERRMRIKETMRAMKGDTEPQVEQTPRRTRRKRATKKSQESEACAGIENQEEMNDEIIAAGEEEVNDIAKEDASIASTNAAGNTADDVERLLLKKENAMLAIDRYKREIKELKERVTVLEKERTAYKDELETMFDYICEGEGYEN